MKFIEFTTHILNNSHINMGIDSKKIPVRLTLNIDEIEAFREELDENEKKDGCIIYMKSGESYWINEDYEYFSKRL